MPASYSPSLSASVAASPTPATSVTSQNTTFRSLRSLLTFGPNKNASTSSPYGATSKNAFPGFGSMRKSLTRDRERKSSLTNLLPIISIERLPTEQSFGDGYVRRAASFSTIETPSSPPSQEQGLPNKFGALNRHSIAEAAPILRSISPGPPLSADLSTIIEADSSGVSRTDPQSSVPPSPDLRLPSTQTSEHHGDNETDASLDLNTNQIAKQVYDAIMDTDVVTAEEWLNAEQPIIIDADTDEDVPMAQFQSDNASINIECVDPSIVALLTPNNLRKKVVKKLRSSSRPSSAGSGGLAPPDAPPSNSHLGNGQSPRRTTPTSSSIPRLRSMISEPTTPGSTSAQSDKTLRVSVTPSSSSPNSSKGQRAKPSDVAHRRVVSSSLLSSTSTSTSTSTATATPAGETRIPVNTESSAAPRHHRAFGHSLTPSLSIAASSSSSSSSPSVPPTPSSMRIASLPVRLRPSLGSGSGSGSLSEAQMQLAPPPLSQQTQQLQQSQVQQQRSVAAKPPPPRTPSPTMLMNATPRHSPQTGHMPGITPNAFNALITSDTPHTPCTPNTPSTPDTTNAQTAPNTPSSARRYFPQGSSAGSISRQNSESGSILGRKVRRPPPPSQSQSQNDVQEEMVVAATASYASNKCASSLGRATTPYGRASLDSTYRRPVSQMHAGCSGSGSSVDPPVLATSTPFRRSCSEDVGATGVRQRSLSSDTISTSRPASPISGRFEEVRVSPGGAPSSSSLNSVGFGVGDGSLSPSPPKSVFRPMFAAPFRLRKRSMSVQEHHKSVQSLLGRKGDLPGAAGGALLQHHRMTGASRSNSSLGGRWVGASAGARERERDVREEGDEPRQRAPHHDWLGPRSVKALRAAGLLSDDRERDRDRDADREPDKHLARNSRERSGSVATSVMSGGSGKTSLGGLGRFVPSAARSVASEYSPQNGRAQSRMAFSDAGGPSGPAPLSVATAGGGGRRESGTFSHPYLMHSPTLTTSTSGSRERESRDRDTPRSVSTAPTSVSSTSLAFMNRDRDEVKELKEKHATETGALLSALSDSQRTTRLLREENSDLRERMERMGDLEAENQELRHEARSLRREINELRIQLLTASGGIGGRGSRNGWIGRGSGVNTPVEERQEWYSRPNGDQRSDVDDTEVLSAVPAKEVVVAGLRAPAWGRPVDRDRRDEPSSPVLEVPARTDTPRRHHRSPSDSSSIFPVLPSNMSMLLHEDNVLLNDQGSSHCGTSPANSHRALDSASTPALTSVSAQARLSSGSNSRVTPLRKPGIPIANGNAANRNSVRLSMTSNRSISPTTANFSIMTGSPGSLFLRPEHEVHLGDMETFSLDFGTRADELGDLDNW